MNRYYCPYCSKRYQFTKPSKDGLIVCGLCGEPVVKIPLIKPIQIFALIAASAFITPLFLMIFSFIKYPEKQKPNINLGQMVILISLNILIDINIHYENGRKLDKKLLLKIL